MKWWIKHSGGAGLEQWPLREIKTSGFKLIFFSGSFRSSNLFTWCSLNVSYCPMLWKKMLSTFHLHRVSFPKSHCFAPFHFQSKNSDLRCISYQRRPSREANTGPSFIGTSLHPLNLASVQLMLSLLDQSSSCCYALLFHPYILYSTVKRRNK